MSKDVLTKLRSARLKEIQDPEYLDSLLGIPQAVRAALESGGHIYHRKEAVRRVLGSICNGNKKLADEEWRGLLAEWRLSWTKCLQEFLCLKSRYFLRGWLSRG